jgi:ADP-ribosylglycohydrolase
MILNGAIGDMMGAPIEMMAYENIHKLYGTEIKHYICTEKMRDRPYTYTDDTEMTICVIDFLINYKRSSIELTTENIMQYFMKYFEPSRGYSAHTLKILLDYTVTGECKIEERISNGGLMRVSPIAIICDSNDDDEILKLIKIIHYPTHCSDESIFTSYLYVKFLIKLRKISKDNDKKSRLLKYLYKIWEKCSEKYKIKNKLKLILDNIDNPDEFDILYDLLDLDGIECYNALSCAIWCIVRNINNPMQILGKGIAYGGDCDTIGSLCGQIGGMLYGDLAINQEWLSHLENKNLIVKLINELIQFKK